MPIRFPTEAANDPGMDDATPDTAPQAPSPSRRDRGQRSDRERGEARPGKDINQAGLLHERDKDGER